jgi:hypothetical protein
VRNTDIGLSHISTIIDPSWEGILQIGLTNSTKFTKQLLYLDPLCVVRFHRIKKQENAEIFERFKQARPHYGNNWWTLEKERGRSLFPRRKEYSRGGEFRKRILREWKKEKYIHNTLKVLGISAILSGVFFVAKLDEKVQRAHDNSIAIDRLEIKFDDFRRTADQTYLIKTGTQMISFTPANTSVSLLVPFERTLTALPYISVVFDGIPETDIKYMISYSREALLSNQYNSATINVQFTGKFGAEPQRECAAKWLIVHPNSSSPTINR